MFRYSLNFGNRVEKKGKPHLHFIFLVSGPILYPVYGKLHITASEDYMNMTKKTDCDIIVVKSQTMTVS